MTLHRSVLWVRLHLCYPLTQSFPLVPLVQCYLQSQCYQLAL